MSDLIGEDERGFRDPRDRCALMRLGNLKILSHSLALPPALTLSLPASSSATGNPLSLPRSPSHAHPLSPPASSSATGNPLSLPRSPSRTHPLSPPASSSATGEAVRSSQGSVHCLSHSGDVYSHRRSSCLSLTPAKPKALSLLHRWLCKLDKGKSSSIPLPTTQASRMPFPEIQYPQPASPVKLLGHAGWLLLLRQQVYSKVFLTVSCSLRCCWLLGLLCDGLADVVCYFAGCNLYSCSVQEACCFPGVFG
ncbi:uncharacterized protein LOC132191019 [Corylus avellana]|uniref:uncharacterized protein LOC132191019 n=1 Tax=Corylus avellana TaxID=13451 RepID=UPI00286C8238|nr:uncharacterized protein LOC132191019 [Corylus avellana]